MVFSNKSLLYIITILFVSFSTLSFANSNDTLPVQSDLHTVAAANHELQKEPVSPEEERKEFIDHHLLDSHDFHLFSLQLQFIILPCSY